MAGHMIAEPVPTHVYNYTTSLGTISTFLQISEWNCSSEQLVSMLICFYVAMFYIRYLPQKLCTKKSTYLGSNILQIKA